MKNEADPDSLANAPLPRSGEFTRVIQSVRHVQRRYDLVICDIWGVVHDGTRAFPDAVRALRAMRAAGVKVMLVSNTQKASAQIPAELAALGVDEDAWDAIITSGDATRTLLRARSEQLAHVISSSLDCATLDAWEVNKAPLEDAHFVFAVSLPEGTTPQDHLPLLGAAAERDLDLICANPDVMVRVGDSLDWCAGALAAEYAEMGGTVVMAGKPFSPIYDLVLKQLNSPIDMDRVLAIGDGIATDIKGANMMGIDCVFVASGVHGETLRRNGRLDSGLVEHALRSHGAWCDFVMERLG